MSIRYVDAARRTGLQTLPCDPDRIARGFRSNERLLILPRRSKFRPVFRRLDVPRGAWLMSSLVKQKGFEDVTKCAAAGF
jgi:hypothetical protein